MAGDTPPPRSSSSFHATPCYMSCISTEKYMTYKNASERNPKWLENYFGERRKKFSHLKTGLQLQGSWEVSHHRMSSSSSWIDLEGTPRPWFRDVGAVAGSEWEKKPSNQNDWTRTELSLRAQESLEENETHHLLWFFCFVFDIFDFAKELLNSFLSLFKCLE